MNVKDTVAEFLANMEKLGHHATVFVDSAEDLEFGTIQHESTMGGHVCAHSNFNSHLAMATSLYDCVQYSPELVQTIQHIHYRIKADEALGFEIDRAKLQSARQDAAGSTDKSGFDTHARTTDHIG